jgi:ComF family protein
VHKIVSNILQTILDFVYPPICISCSALGMRKSISVCEKCWDSIRRVTDQDSLFQESRHRLRAEGHVDDLESVFLFEKGGPFQHIAHAIKYQSFQSLAVSLGRELGKKILVSRIDADALVPVPLHRAKQRERGYNQAELIARGAAEVSGISLLSDVLLRTRYTKTQTTLSIDERRTNMHDAFVVRDTRMASAKRIILVDDVITTGATKLSCAESLKRAGALHVLAASVALAQKDVGGQ